MPLELVPSFLIFCYLNMITPGPANIYSLSCTLNFGRKRALKMWWGLFTGFTLISLISVIMIYFAGLIIGEYVFFLSYIGAAYLVWLAYQILRTSKETNNPINRLSCSFVSGFILQLTNFKIILFCVTVLGTFVLPYSTHFSSLLLMGCFLPLTGPICNLVWIYAGTKLQKLFDKYKTVFNWIMALALIFTAISFVL